MKTREDLSKIKVVLLAQQKSLTEARLHVIESKTKLSHSNALPSSATKRSPISYGQSFNHIAKNSNFQIDPLLPSLKPPTNPEFSKKQFFITSTSKDKIIPKIPHAYQPHESEKTPHSSIRTTSARSRSSQSSVQKQVFRKVVPRPKPKESNHNSEVSSLIPDDSFISDSKENVQNDDKKDEIINEEAKLQNSDTNDKKE